jgi:hypothetical protein
MVGPSKYQCGFCLSIGSMLHLRTNIEEEQTNQSPKKDKRKNNDLQNIHIKLKNE